MQHPNESNNVLDPQDSDIDKIQKTTFMIKDGKPTKSKQKSQVTRSQEKQGLKKMP